MNSDCSDGATAHRWRTALAGSAVVSVAVATVFWVVDDAVVATIVAIAIVMIALLAVFGGGRGRGGVAPTAQRRQTQE